MRRSTELGNGVLRWRLLQPLAYDHIAHELNAATMEIALGIREAGEVKDSNPRTFTQKNDLHAQRICVRSRNYDAPHLAIVGALSV